MAGLTRMSPGVADALAFLGRVARLAPDAPCRVHAEPTGVSLWAPLPWHVLVTRTVGAPLPAGVWPVAEVSAALAAGTAPAGGAGTPWRWSLPDPAGPPVELIPATEVLRIGRAAEETLRAVHRSGVGGRPVRERALRDALLDHVPIVVVAEGRRYEVNQRLIQAVLRMGFLDSRDELTTVSVVAGQGWVGLAARYGTAWCEGRRRLTLTPASTRVQ